MKKILNNVRIQRAFIILNLVILGFSESMQAFGVDAARSGDVIEIDVRDAQEAEKAKLNKIKVVTTDATLTSVTESQVPLQDEAAQSGVKEIKPIDEGFKIESEISNNPEVTSVVAPEVNANSSIFNSELDETVSVDWNDPENQQLALWAPQQLVKSDYSGLDSPFVGMHIFKPSFNMIRGVGVRAPMLRADMPKKFSLGRVVETDLVMKPVEANFVEGQVNPFSADISALHGKLYDEVTYNAETNLTLHTLSDVQNNVVSEIVLDAEQNKVFEVTHLVDENAIVQDYYAAGKLDYQVVGEYDAGKNLIKETKYDSHRNKLAELLFNPDGSYVSNVYNGFDYASEVYNYDAQDVLLSKATYDSQGNKISENIYNNDGSYVNRIYSGKDAPYLETKYNSDGKIAQKSSFNAQGKKLDEFIYNNDGTSINTSYSSKTGKALLVKNYNAEQTKILARFETANLLPEAQRMILKFIEKNPKFNEDVDLNNMVNSMINSGNNLTDQQIASISKEILDPYSTLTNKQKNNFIKTLIIFRPLNDAQVNLVKIATRKNLDSSDVVNGIMKGTITSEADIISAASQS